MAGVRCDSVYVRTSGFGAFPRSGTPRYRVGRRQEVMASTIGLRGPRVNWFGGGFPDTFRRRYRTTLRKSPSRDDNAPLNADALKRAAAEKALEYVESGMSLGLGTGSTVRHLVDLLGQRLKDGRLVDIVGVPTSVQTEEQARSVGIPLTTLDGRSQLDLTIDGADEIAPGLDLIKGLGAALLREKMVAQASRRLIIISDDSKLVRGLGTKAPLPVEVVDWALGAQQAFLERTGADVRLRLDGNGTPVRSDNGNVFLDARYPGGISDPAGLEDELLRRAGIVDTGLFLGMTERAVIASADGVFTLTPEASIPETA